MVSRAPPRRKSASGGPRRPHAPGPAPCTASGGRPGGPGGPGGGAWGRAAGTSRARTRATGGQASATSPGRVQPDPARGREPGRGGVHCAAPRESESQSRSPAAAGPSNFAAGGAEEEQRGPLPGMVSGLAGWAAATGRGASPAINSCCAGVGGWCQRFVSACLACSEPGDGPGPCPAAEWEGGCRGARGGGMGRGCGGGARRVAAHAGGAVVELRTAPPPTHLVVCRFWFSAGGGGVGGGGGRGSQQFWGPSVRRLFGKRLEAGGRQLQANCRLPQTLPLLGTHYLWMARGIPCPREPRQDRSGGGRRRPWRFLYNPAAREAGPGGFAVEAAGLPAPVVFNLACPWLCHQP